jgi:hypothetical protein
MNCQENNLIYDEVLFQNVHISSIIYDQSGGDDIGSKCIRTEDDLTSGKIMLNLVGLLYL